MSDIEFYVPNSAGKPYTMSSNMKYNVQFSPQVSPVLLMGRPAQVSTQLCQEPTGKTAGMKAVMAIIGFEKAPRST